MEINLNIEKKHFIVISIFLGLIALTLATDVITAAGVPVVGGVWHPLSGISGDGGITSIDNGSGYIRADAIEGGSSSGSIPTGAIIMWAGNLVDIPTDWQLCDGTGGTPDLRSRFVRGTADGVDPGLTGGADEHTLTVAEMPAHSHSLSTTVLSDNYPVIYNSGSEIMYNGGTINTNSAGDSQPHNNMPAYFEVAFICKI